MAEQKRLFLSSQGTEVNKNSTSYTRIVSPQKKKKKKEKKNKERVWDQTNKTHTELNLSEVYMETACRINSLTIGI